MYLFSCIFLEAIFTAFVVWMERRKYKEIQENIKWPYAWPHLLPSWSFPGYGASAAPSTWMLPHFSVMKGSTCHSPYAFSRRLSLASQSKVAIRAVPAMAPYFDFLTTLFNIWFHSFEAIYLLCCCFPYSNISATRDVFAAIFLNPRIVLGI